MLSWLPLGVAFVAFAAALLLLAHVMTSGSRTGSADPSLALARRLQAQWQLPILTDGAIAERIVKILTVPAVKESYRLSFVIAPDFGDSGNPAALLEEDAIEIEVEEEYAFVNLTRRELTLSVGHAQPDGQRHLERQLRSLSIDASEIPLSGPDWERRHRHEVRIPPGGRRAILTRSVYFGRTPYVIYLPQSVAVYGGMKLEISTHLREAVRVMVTGHPEASFHVQATLQDDGEADAESGVRKLATSVKDPLLPGDAVLLSVGL